MDMGGEVRSYLLRVIGEEGEEVASFQCSVFREEEASGVGEFAFGFGDGASEGLGGFDPLGDDDFGVGDGFFVGGPVGHAAGEFRDFDEEGLIFFAPVDDEFVAHVSRFLVGI